MLRLAPAVMTYPWGSATAIPEFCGTPSSDTTLAEAWFGAHPSGPTMALDAGRDGEAMLLREVIATDPVGTLGGDVVERLGPTLPFLVKLIAPDSPLSLQVHPNAAQAALGYVREERTGIPVDSPTRTYRDPNHKPELLYALTTFEALSGFRTPRRVLEVLEGLERVPLIAKSIERIRQGSSATGMRSALEYMLLGARDRDSDVGRVVELIEARVASGTSPSIRSDAVALRLAAEHPGDRGVLASLLLNPVTLKPGEVMFVPAGCVHAYLSGLAVEVMASSDNVVRAGLTRKHIDARALLEIVDVKPAPPMRMAAERSSDHIDVFYAPVEDFELAVISTRQEPVTVGGAGPRVVLAIDGEMELVSGEDSLRLRRGEAAFLADPEEVTLSGNGRLVRASVP